MARQCSRIVRAGCKIIREHSRAILQPARAARTDVRAIPEHSRAARTCSRAILHRSRMARTSSRAARQSSRTILYGSQCSLAGQNPCFHRELRSRGSTPALGCGWLRPRSQPRGAHAGHGEFGRVRATRVFRAGAENGTRGRVRSPFCFAVRVHPSGAGGVPVRLRGPSSSALPFRQSVENVQLPTFNVQRPRPLLVECFTLDVERWTFPSPVRNPVRCPLNQSM